MGDEEHHHLLQLSDRCQASMEGVWREVNKCSKLYGHEITCVKTHYQITILILNIEVLVLMDQQIANEPIEWLSSVRLSAATPTVVKYATSVQVGACIISLNDIHLLMKFN